MWRRSRPAPSGAAPQAPLTSTTLTFNPPYPAPAQTVGSSTTAISNLATQLATNLQVQVTGSLGVLNPIIGALGTDQVNPFINGVITPIVVLLAMAVGFLLVALRRFRFDEPKVGFA